jgi:hypothetical protein
MSQEAVAASPSSLTAEVTLEAPGHGEACSGQAEDTGDGATDVDLGAGRVFGRAAEA